jgi:uncharacterized protein YmfQ (DUF2313 family)
VGVAFTYSAPDYVAAMFSLGHRGRAWTTDPGTVRYSVMTGLAQHYVRSGARMVNLITDAFPATTLELLPEWELSLGLPDLCAEQPQTVQQRQAAVLAKFIATGGQSVTYYTAVAAALGYVVTITEFSAFRAGSSRAGTPCGDAFVHVWQVNAPTFTIGTFKAGISTAGEPLRWWSNTALQCTLRALAPAHTLITFSYS